MHHNRQYMDYPYIIVSSNRLITVRVNFIDNPLLQWGQGRDQPRVWVQDWTGSGMIDVCNVDAPLPPPQLVQILNWLSIAAVWCCDD